MFMVLSSWQSHCESSPGSFDECRTAPSSRRPKTKPDDLGCESACTGCQNLHPPSLFIIITQPESWYSFYRPTEGRRLSRPSWLVTYRDGLPVHRRSPILVLTRSDVSQLRWSRRTRYHYPNGQQYCHFLWLEMKYALKFKKMIDDSDWHWVTATWQLYNTISTTARSF